MITIIDVMREMDIEPVKHLTWAVGQRVVAAYKYEYGTLPIKDLRQKTNDPESVHCFALYPEDFRSVIVDVINIYCERRYLLAGRRYTLAQLAELRGTSIAIMGRRLQGRTITAAVYGG